ncbi:hypothetical protein RUM43_001198 [Polyplax serrata]|uniref:Dynein axonemal assembly factor 1 homolog n=1 Tax=Polyplax serrata TaxID=468196 RepID=A0AAN8XTH4_POLSC
MADEEGFENEGEFIPTETELPRALTKDEAADCLNCVGPTFKKIDEVFSYRSVSYAYIAMNVVERNLTNVDVLPYFTHVMCLNLSRNRLTDDSLSALAEMEQLLTLVVDKNYLESAILPVFPLLQILSLKDNRISTCEVNFQPNLRYLELAGNNIQQIQPALWGPDRLPKLKELGLRNNGLRSSAGIIFPNLVSLFLAENEIKSLEGLEVLTNLKFLHLRDNPLTKLDGFSEVNRKLFYINIRGCKIKNIKELKKLSVLPKLERIVVSENPFATEDYRIQAIAMLPKLSRIDKTIVEKNEKRKAKSLAKRMSSAEKDEENDKENDEDEVPEVDEEN